MTEIINMSRQLSRVKRFQVYNLFNEYNVAEHSYRVAMLCYVLCDDVSIRDEAVRKALVHDLEESILGDFPGPLKRKNKDFAIAYEKLAFETIKENFKDEDHVKLWHEAKLGESGILVYLADNLEAFQTVVEEVEAGNKSVIILLNKFLNGYSTIYPTKYLKKFPKAVSLLDDLILRGVEAK